MRGEKLVERLIIVVVAIATFVAVALSARLITGSKGAESPMQTAFPAAVASHLGDLADLHERMLAEGLALTEAEMLSVTDDADYTFLRLLIDGTAWLPLGAMPVRHGEHEVRLTSEKSRLAVHAIPLGSRVLSVIDSEGVLLALAGLDGPSSFHVPQGWTQGPLFLASAGIELFESGVDPVPAPPCSSDAFDFAAGFANPVDALIGYFDRLGDSSVRDRHATLARLDEDVERLVLLHDNLVDPVTGLVAQPSRNDLANQLLRGTEPEQVQIRPAIPLRVRVPTANEGVPDRRLAVLVAEPSGLTLGFAGLAPLTMEVGEGQPVEVTEWIMFVSPPDPGNHVSVYIRSPGRPDLTCRGAQGEEPAIVIPYEDFAGSTRVVLDLGSLTYDTVTDL